MLYVFTGGWNERVAAVAAGDAPAEAHAFFALRERGTIVEAVDDRIAPAAVRLVSTGIQRVWHIPRTRLGYRLHVPPAVRRLLARTPADAVVATTDALALPLLASRRAGRLETPVLYVSVGLHARIDAGEVAPGALRRLRDVAAAAAAVLVFAPAERDFFAAWLPGMPVHLVPLGVDARWWADGSEGSPAVDVFSCGRDPHRDFATLAVAVEGTAWSAEIVGDLAHEQGIRPTPRLAVRGNVDVRTLRARLHRARVVVVPSRPASHGAGQTTALQAMAAGKPVVFSDTGWAHEAGLRHGEHFVDVAPGSAGALRDAIAGVLSDEEAARAMAARGQAAVRAHFSAAHQAEAMERALGAAIRDEARPCR